MVTLAVTATSAATAATAAATGDWERLWAPYDEATYQQVLDWLGPEDTVLDIGAGDLRLARRLARKVSHVYAIELSRSLATMATRPQPSDNLTLIWGDAYRVPFPVGITTAVLLMRHCQGFLTLINKLRYVGCRQLITNARWRLAVELVDLQSQPIPHTAVSMGWYACRCGATGFVQGLPEKLTPHVESAVYEIVDGPACKGKERLIG
jgi:SAM-dependent methyltransferase